MISIYHYCKFRQLVIDDLGRQLYNSPCIDRYSILTQFTLRFNKMSNFYFAAGLTILCYYYLIKFLFAFPNYMYLYIFFITLNIYVHILLKRRLNNEVSFRSLWICFLRFIIHESRYNLYTRV